MSSSDTTNLSSYTCSAVISGDGKYRYYLGRDWEWDQPANRLGFIMLNPSTADASEDDPTIRRCVGFAAQWGYTGIRVVNLMSYRATDPSHIPEDRMESVGYPLTHRHYARIKRETSLLVAAWGAGPNLLGTDHCNKAVVSCTPEGTVAQSFGRTLSGDPKHPLMLPGNTELVKYRKVG